MDDRSLSKLHQFFSIEAEKRRLVLVYLFGSQVSGHVGPLSDLDLAILFEKYPDPRERYALAHQIATQVGSSRVDVVILNRAPIELQYNVITMGMIIYESNRLARIEFEARVLSRYFDYLPVLRSQRQELLRERHDASGIQRYRAALRKTESVLAEIRAT